MTIEEIERDEFEFQVALMLEEEREFNRQKLRETGYLRRSAAARTSSCRQTKSLV
jgi:hypothetical protein